MNAASQPNAIEPHPLSAAYMVCVGCGVPRYGTLEAPLVLLTDPLRSSAMWLRLLLRGPPMSPFSPTERPARPKAGRTKVSQFSHGHKYSSRFGYLSPILSSPIGTGPTDWWRPAPPGPPPARGSPGSAPCQAPSPDPGPPWSAHLRRRVGRQRHP